MANLDDPILARLRAELTAAYGVSLERAVLFGSRARRDARPDSDYGVAVFLKDFEGFGREAARIAAIETEILNDTGAVISALPFKAGAYKQKIAAIGLATVAARSGAHVPRI
jgi:predicted nucleotidyltransferase